MNKKTKRQVGALRRLLAKRDRLAGMKQYHHRLQVFIPCTDPRIESEIKALKERIPDEVLISEGLYLV